MDNPAVHDLDDVRLRAENGQIVLEVNGQTTPVNVDVDGALSLDELKGFTDEEISLLQSKLVNAGHDEVDVPQVRNLTVDDFESGTLSASYGGNTGVFSVQSSIVANGNYALEADASSTGLYDIQALSGLDTFPQPGDTFNYSFYLTDTNDQLKTKVGVSDSGFLAIRTYSDSNDLEIRDKYSNQTVSTNVGFDSYLNEWLTAEVEWGKGGEFIVRVYDSNNSKLGEVSASGVQAPPGGVEFEVFNGTVSPTLYWDNWTLERRSPKYFSDTQKGTTELGNEVTPSGAIHTGPLESSTNALRQEYATAPVNSNATQGDTSLLTLLKSGINPAMYMERTFDGQGGAYGHQLQTALGRFARINANLSWEYDTLADVPNWMSTQNGVSNWTFNVNNRPRRIHVEHDGSGNTSFGGLNAEANISEESIGPFRLSFKGVSFTNADDSNGYRIGISDVSPNTNIRTNGNGIFVFYAAADFLDVVNSGSQSNVQLSTQANWGTEKYDITIEYDGVEARAFIDGELVGSISTTITSDFKPIIQSKKDSGNSTAETVEVEQVTVEPLPEVLQ